MLRTSALAALLLAAPAPPAGAPSPAPPPPAVTATMSYSEHVVIRVPMPRGTAMPAPIQWKETKGPRCIDMNAIAGAAMVGPSAVDFVLRGGKRVRAKLDHDCPALDYYVGFYLVAVGDGQVCADRDAVHARSGGACDIDRFRELKPAK